MKKILLLGFALILGLAVVSQGQLVKGKFSTIKPIDKNAVAIDPVPSLQASSVITPLPTQTKSANVVTVLTLGTSANGLGWGYGGGQRRHLWADNDIKSVGLMHRMGPVTGTSPPSFTGYLAMDHATNYGATQADWNINYQVHAATLNLSGTYYMDAARYPQGGIYNPAGNTDPNNAYFVYFAASFADINNVGSTSPTWGGYVYGTGKWSDQADSTKHIDWYTPPPKRDIPEGLTITPQGKVFVTDLNYSFGNGYDGNVYLETGVWNTTTLDFDYTASLLELPAPLGAQPVTEKVSADPTGTHVWVGTIANDGSVNHAFDSTYYPVLFHSSDGGATFGSRIAVAIDGPTGIPAIKNYISDARLALVYAPNTPPGRDEIPYTCAFEGDMTVDKWGNPHLACVVCLPGSGFTIINPDGANSPTFDSTAAVFDIYSTDRGTTWCARMMGIVKHMVGGFPSGTYTEYNRVNISRNALGDKVFVTYDDTWVTSATDNSSPDIFARGWDLLNNKLTSNSGQDAANNVTYLSDVTQNAVCGDQANLAFTKSDGSSVLAIACESITGGSLDNAVTFKYIPNFSYAQSDFTIDGNSGPWGSVCNFPLGISDQAAASALNASVYPNPVKGTATVRVEVPQSGNVTVEITNLVGQKVMSFTKNLSTTGMNTFSLDASQLTSGVYFYTVKQGSQKVSGKIIVE